MIPFWDFQIIQYDLDSPYHLSNQSTIVRMISSLVLSKLLVGKAEVLQNNFVPSGNTDFFHHLSAPCYPNVVKLSLHKGVFKELALDCPQKIKLLLCNKIIGNTNVSLKVCKLATI